ncbi:MAG: HIT domain-containing protein [Microthrixaceae bacterium]
MSVDQLWATWRSLYVTGDPESRRALPGELADSSATSSSSETEPQSLFERILNCGAPDSETFVLHRGSDCFVILNRFPYTSGHLMILPNRAVANLEDLGPSEFEELWRLVRDGVTVLKAKLNCDGVNIGVNLGRAAGGSQTDHLHVHCVPRWIGDANFMALIGGSQVMPVALGDLWAVLSAAWPDSPENAAAGTVI